LKTFTSSVLLGDKHKGILMTVKKPKKSAKPKSATSKKAIVGAANEKPSLLTGRGLVLFVCAFVLVGLGTVIFSLAATAQGQIKSAVALNKCLDNKDDATANKNKIQINTCSSLGTAQKWTVKDNGTIVNGNGYCLDVANAAKVRGTLVQLYKCNSTVAQKWSIKSNGSIVNPQSGLCLDVKHAGKTDGTQVWVWTCNSTVAQKWTLPPKTVTPTPVPNPTPTPTPSPAPEPGDPAVKPIGVSGNWNLKFDDEFNGTGLNSKYWAKSWFGGGMMNNVATSATNQKVEGGVLVLTLSSSTEGALVSTDPSQVSPGFEFGYGYAEAKVYFPGSGSTIYNFPAWWTTGQPNWPVHGENDVAEGLGSLTSNYHWGPSADSDTKINNSGTTPGTWSNSWHTYGVLRAAGKNSIYWDGKLVRSYTTYEKGAPHFLLFNVGAGQGPTKTGATGALKIDYVRVWQ
jgi:hypothetical protein